MNFKKYEGLIIFLANKYSSVDQDDLKDLIQAGWLGFSKAINTYRKDGGSVLSTWIYIHVRSEIQKEKNSEHMISCCPSVAEKYNISLEKHGLRLPDKLVPEDMNTPLEILIKKEDDMEFSRKTLNYLNNLKTSEEKRNILISYFVHGKTLKDISQKYKKSIRWLVGFLKKI